MQSDVESVYLQWVEDYYQDVYRWCLRYAGNEHDAADLTQETFTNAFRHMRSFRGDSSPRTWLLTIATRAHLRSVRAASALDVGFVRLWVAVYQHSAGVIWLATAAMWGAVGCAVTWLCLFWRGRLWR